jgi:peptidoglycan hydrolase-like protein with peptidoglycan-binding domain
VTRKTWVLAGAAVLAAVIATGGVVVMSGAKQQALAAQQPPAHTAQVEKRTLSAMVSQPGILTYRARSDGSPYSLINQARGTYTKLPTPGQMISQGHVLYRVNDSPVVLLHGSTPAYRTISAGATGPDVAELNADLVALGYATSAQLHPRSAFFGSATAAALDKLQAALGVPQSGTLALGQAVFGPTAVRVTSVSGQLGRNTQPGQTVLQGTSTNRQVQVALDASQQTDVAVGDKVTITLPDDHTSPGCRLLGGYGRHLPVELRVGRSGVGLRRTGNGHLLVRQLGEHHADDRRGRHPV